MMSFNSQSSCISLAGETPASNYFNWVFFALIIYFHTNNLKESQNHNN